MVHKMLTTDNAPLVGAAIKQDSSTVTIKVIKGTMIEGKRANPGDVVDCKATAARQVIALGKAEAFERPKPKKRAVKKNA